jgi:hypothetical protein
MYHTYTVDEILYTLGVPETIQYELKTHVVDSFENADKYYTYVIHRSRRATETDQWSVLDTWSVRANNREAVVAEGNISYLVLRFPLTLGMTWNGNTYNSQIDPITNSGMDLYTVKDLRASKTYNGSAFSDVVVIEQEDNKEFITTHDERWEVYARNVGLVYKEKILLLYCNDENRDCVGQQVVDDGLIYKQTIKEYGLD